MKTLLGVLLFCTLSWPGARQERFEAVEVWIDAGTEELAAWQVRLADPTGRVRIVSVEGGEHPAFAEAPYYDLRAIDGEEIVLAAFSLEEELPRGETRVARVHLLVQGDTDVNLTSTLEVATDGNGTELTARALLRK